MLYLPPLQLDMILLFIAFRCRACLMPPRAAAAITPCAVVSHVITSFLNTAAWRDMGLFRLTPHTSQAMNISLLSNRSSSCRTHYQLFQDKMARQGDSDDRRAFHIDGAMQESYQEKGDD